MNLLASRRVDLADERVVPSLLEAVREGDEVQVELLQMLVRPSELCPNWIIDAWQLQPNGPRVVFVVCAIGVHATRA